MMISETNRAYICILVFLFCFAQSGRQVLCAQNAPRVSKDDGAWINLTMPFHRSWPDPEVGLGFNITRAANHTLLTVRVLNIKDNFGPMRSSVFVSGNHYLSFYEVGLLRGVLAKNRWFLASFAAGFGALVLKKEGSLNLNYPSSGAEERESAMILYSRMSENVPEVQLLSFGIPLEAELIFIPIGGFGVGINGIANVNPKLLIWGFLVVFHFRIS